MRLVWLLAALPLVISQVMYYQQPRVQYRTVQQPVQIQIRPVSQQQRQVYYPVRTNCNNNCQNRYRWNSRPSVKVNVAQKPVQQVVRPTVQVRPAVQTVQVNRFSKPIQTVQTVKPQPVPTQPPRPFVPVTPSRPVVAPVAPQTGTAGIRPPMLPIPLATQSPPRMLPVTPSTLPTPPPETITPEVTRQSAPPTAFTDFITDAVEEATQATTVNETPAPSSTTEQPTEATTEATRPTEAETEATEATEATVVTDAETEETEAATEPSTMQTDDETETTPSVTPTTYYMRPNRKEFTTPRPMKTTFTNPCPSGKALVNSFSTPIPCNHLVLPNAGCPEDHWCHTGTTFATTACCPITDKNANRCEMRRDAGEGTELAARWYFDPLAKQCKRFLYKGLRGNANNFVTQAQCIDACESKAIVNVNNPCRFGEPAKDLSTKDTLMCGPSDTGRCPDGFYCHIGENPETTACCEGSGLSDPCLLSINIGQGSSAIKRWYYNTIAKRCTEFVYKGMRGNENNFLTFAECERTCQKWSNPCPTALNHQNKKECSVDGDECGVGEWCHVGGGQESTVCCPNAVPSVASCELPLALGEGTGNLTRWYADPADKSCNRKCKQFTYAGSKGNQNNFLTKELCEQQCKRECPNPCGSGQLLLTPQQEPRQCSPVSPCPSTHWCHVGGTPETTVCCSAVNNTCALPVAVGHGQEHWSRWHFDAGAKKCTQFMYSGMGGNQNMFLTLEDCQAVCPTYNNPCASGKPLLVGASPKVCNPSSRCPSTHFCHIGITEDENYCCPKNGDPCEQGVATGYGKHSLTRFYFDKETRRCREFVYKGTKGNANNFLSLSDCEMICPVLPNPCALGEPDVDVNRQPVICGMGGEGEEDGCRAGFYCHVGKGPETTNCCPGTRRPCDLPMEVGSGDDKLERWFFDGSVQMCRQFNYKGMKGNSNNFLTRQACRAQCTEVNPCGEGEPLTTVDGDRVQCTVGSQAQCPRSHYCHVGGSALNTVCCPKISEDPCDLTPSKGTGMERLPRFFFNPEDNQCESFTYLGVGGNQNNFLSMQECRQTCPEYRAYCPHGLPLVTNGTVAACGIDRGCPDGHICHMSTEHNVSVCCQDPMDFCLAPRDPGPCDRFETRYGYHALSDTCVEYQYGGCEGTLNNFHSLQRCTEICCKEYKRRH